MIAAHAQIQVDGPRLLTPEGEELTLRGANWGWWDCVESGDAHLIRAWGGNVVRIAFFHSKITLSQGKLGGEGLALLDAMCRWAEDAEMYFILDCHEPPGGCNTARWCANGRNQLWADPAMQDRFESMWRELAHRYRDHEHLLAYEIMNEPCPPRDYPVADYRALCERIIDALRQEDPGRLCVVTGVNWGGPNSLVDEIVLDRPGIIYTFHFYDPGAFTHYRGGDYIYPGPLVVGTKWLSNSPENWGASGDTGWTTLEKSFEPPQGATYGKVHLRSTDNSGKAWFDDVELLCDGEPVEFSSNNTFGLEARSAHWGRERQTSGQLAWDEKVGGEAPGSLRIEGTDSYDGWVSGDLFAVKVGATYAVRCRVRTEAATGSTYPMVAWFTGVEAMIDRDYLKRGIEPALEFRRRHGVPVYCGEFGCSQALPQGSGIRWVRDVASVLNEAGIPWTYWNWRETTGPGSMGVWVKDATGHYTLNGDLWKTVVEGWRG